MAWMINALLLHACLIPMLFNITFAFKQGRISGGLLLKCLASDTVLAEMLFSLVHLETLEKGCSRKGCCKVRSVAVYKAI